MELTPEEVRVLGCLLEKEATTPDQYPLTTNALLSACNQKSNRDPVVAYDDRTIDGTVLALRERGLARTIKGTGRAWKHKHVLDEAWGLGAGELAVMTVLMLRGPQTPGELRTRTERIHPFDSLDEVDAVLDRLAGGEEPWVVQLERRPGQKEARWAHLLTGEPDEPAAVPSAAVPAAAVPASPAAPPPAGEVAELRAEVADLRSRIEALEELLLS